LDKALASSRGGKNHVIERREGDWYFEWKAVDPKDRASSVTYLMVTLEWEEDKGPYLDVRTYFRDESTLKLGEVLQRETGLKVGIGGGSIGDFRREL
jgi:hypothetical protein